jgi:MFS family permease
MSGSVSAAPGFKFARVFVPISVFFFWYSHYVYMPVLPEYVRQRTLGFTQVGIVLAMYGFWQVVSRLPIGMLTDRMGRRKPMILLGIVLAGVGAMILSAADAFPLLLVGRSLIGLSMWAWVLQVVFYGALFDGTQLIRAGSILTLSSSFAKLAGTFTSGFFSQYGEYFVIFAAAVVAALCAFIFMVPVGEKRRSEGGSVLFRLKIVVRSRKVWVVSLLGGINQFLNFGITFGFFPLIATMLGADAAMKGYLLSCNIAFLILGNLSVTYFGKRRNVFLILVLSYLCFSVSIIGTPLAPSLAVLFPLQALLGLAHGLGYPVLIALCMEDIPESARASAMGLHQSVYAVGMFLGPWAAGVLADAVGLHATFASIGAGSLLISAALLIYLKLLLAKGDD